MDASKQRSGTRPAALQPTLLRPRRLQSAPTETLTPTICFLALFSLVPLPDLFPAIYLPVLETRSRWLSDLRSGRCGRIFNLTPDERRCRGSSSESKYEAVVCGN